jgi:hypothetical protein
MRALLLFSVVFLLFDSCIEPFDIKGSAAEPILIVEGMVTDQPGPYTVTLSYARDLEDQLSPVKMATGATVTLFDNNNNSETLVEKAPGVYQTSSGGIQGVVGSQYFIRVTLSDQVELESAPEELVPVGELRKLYYEFDQNVSGGDDDYVNPSNGFSIYVDGEVLPEQKGRVRWRATGTFEMKTFPELRVKWVPSTKGVLVAAPDPPECSGYYVYKGALTYLSPCDCCTCWVNQYNDDPVLSDPKFLEGGEATGVLVDFVPASRRLFHRKYYVEVEQMSISENLFEFWDAIKKQRETGTDLFQTPPPQVLGNISVKKGSIRVMGYFGASSVRTASVMLDASLLPYTLPSIDTVTESCASVYKNSTYAKPLFW